MKRTTCMYLVSNELKVLLIKHPKFGVWLPPGGHIEDGESTWEALHRELIEEVGYDIGDGIEYNIDCRATRVRQPFFVQIEDHGDHYVEDQLFFKVIEEQPLLVSPEGMDIQWWSIDEAMNSKELFINTQEHIAEIKFILEAHQ